MKNITEIMARQVTEAEAMIYLLVASGMSYRDLADRLGISHTQIMRTYKDVEKKIG